MKTKSIALLGGLTAVVIAATFVARQSRESAKASNRDASGPLLPGLADSINDVGTLHVVQGEDAVTIERGPLGWEVSERSGYPAEFETVKETLLSLAELEILEPKTALPENYAKLGLADPTEPGARATLIEVRDPEGGEIAAVVIGDSSYKGTQSTIYVRERDEPQTYACLGEVEVQVDPMEWVEKELLRIDGKRVREATIEHADGEVVRLLREERTETDFVLQDVPPGRAEAFEGTGNGIATSLAFLRMEDVRRASEVDFTAEPLSKTTFRCYDGLEVVVEAARHEEETWFRLRAKSEATAEEAPDSEAAPDASGESTSGSQSEADAAREARRIERELAPWAFRFPEFKTEGFLRRKEELLAEEAPPSPLLPGVEPEVETGVEPGDGAAGGNGLEVDDAGEGQSELDAAPMGGEASSEDP